MTGLAYPRENIVLSKWSVALYTSLHYELLVLQSWIVLLSVYSTQLWITPKFLLHDAVRGVILERDDALKQVLLLEEEKVQVQERVTFLEGEVVEASFNASAVNDSNDKLQQHIRAVERVNALLTDSLNMACFAQNQPNHN